eukprot:g46201.t1
MVILVEAQDGHVTQGVGGGVEVFRDRKVLLFVANRMQVLHKTVSEPPLGLTDIEDTTSGAADARDHIDGCAGEPLSDVNGLFGALDGGEEGRCRGRPLPSGVLGPAASGSCGFKPYSKALTTSSRAVLYTVGTGKMQCPGDLGEWEQFSEEEEDTGSEDVEADVIHDIAQQKLKREDPAQKVVQCWSQAAEEFLQDCLDSMGWSTFKNSVDNLDGNMDELGNPLPTRHATFKSDDTGLYRKSRYNLHKAIRDAKRQYEASKTKQLIIDYRNKGGRQAPIHINGAEVERVESVKFLGVTITSNLSWTTHIDVKKAKQRLFSFKRLRKFSVSIRTLTNFYRFTTKSILSGCIVAWYGNFQDWKKPQIVANTAQTITQANL